MASKNFFNQIFHRHAGPQGMVIITGQMTVTGDSTPGDSTAIFSAKSKGWASAARTGVGEYTMTLSDSYVGVLSANVTMQAAADLTTGQHLKIVSVNAVTKAVVVAFTDEAGAPEDLTDAEVAVVNIMLCLDNSSKN
jgi:hypothetical protein